MWLDNSHLLQITRCYFLLVFGFAYYKYLKNPPHIKLSKKEQSEREQWLQLSGGDSGDGGGVGGGTDLSTNRKRQWLTCINRSSFSICCRWSGFTWGRSAATCLHKASKSVREFSKPSLEDVSPSLRITSSSIKTNFHVNFLNIIPQLDFKVYYQFTYTPWAASIVSE